MRGASFRFAGTTALLVLIVPILAASCGGSGQKAATEPSQPVVGSGFRFAAPRGWTVSRVGSAVTVRGAGGSDAPLVSVTTYRLAKPYSPALFATAAKELDGIAVKLAQASNGTLTESVTTTVDGRRIRAYRFTAHPAGHPATDDRIGFVLAGSREYQLLCQAPAGSNDPDGGCALLFASFSAAVQ